MQRQTVAGHNIETDARHDHDPGIPRSPIQRSMRFENRDLTGDVEIVSTARQAGFDHRLGGL